MDKIKKFFIEELVYGAHLISFGSVGITLSILLILRKPIDLLLLAISYLIFQIIYTYNHFKEIKFDIQSNPERVQHMAGKEKWRQVSPFIYMLLLGCFLVLTNWPTFLLVTFIVIGGILYTEFFKTIPVLGFKSYYVSLFWALSVLVIPFFYQENSIIPYLYLFLFIFIRGIVNTVFSDIKDIESDGKRHLKTFPVYWGKDKTLSILQIINIVSVLPLIIGIYTNVLPMTTLLLIVTIINGLFYLSKASYMSEKNLRFLSYILIDGEYILWPVVIFIGRYFV